MSLALGAAIRHEWGLDPDFLTVNHGSYGATPLVVRAEQDRWRKRMEAQPTWFFFLEVPGALREAAGALARFLSAEAEDVVFVPNATTGANAVLRSLQLEPGDEILHASHVYNAVRNTISYVAERAGAKVAVAEIPFPRPEAAAILKNIRQAIGKRTRIAVIDHITSPSGMVLPIEEIIQLCHAAGVPVLVDGAHGPGQVALDLPALGADWYVGTCHKWLCAPKGCGFLYARSDRRAELHPVTISHGYGGGFTTEFDWTGTMDPSAYRSGCAARHDPQHGFGAIADQPRGEAVGGGEGAARAAGRRHGCPGSSGRRGDVVAFVGLRLQRDRRLPRPR
jgi:isopenicillin-N epimerase